ncbi:MAG: MFS transporter [Proteobacteria bacterium]|nr:MFS transporter [Pseudomonadota bacterium]MDA0951438.1 MFS transporter [Pseudomonadota bacterium]
MTEATAAPGAGWRTPMVVILAGCAIAVIGFGIRSVFGFFLDPITEAHGWSRETYSVALSVQNLLWGLAAPLAGILADRYGPARVIVLGALIYGAATWAMGVVESSVMFTLVAGVAVGFGVAFTGFSLALAAMARVVPPHMRSLALGLGTASGSLGQVIFALGGQGAISLLGWQGALIALAATAMAIIPLAFVLPRSSTGVGEVVSNQSVGQALKEAAGHRGYLLLTTGFFVCGFQIAFITVHFPAYITDQGLLPWVAAWAWFLVGGCNIVGCLLAGMFGQRWSKRCGLSGIYFARTLIIVGLLLAPKTEWTIYAFAIAMGSLWLATVPLTSGIVAQVFGVKYMATLFGVVFFSHQLGSFTGVWLGGWLYDATGSYDIVWWISAGLGLVAALIHLPIDERPLARLHVAR